MGCLIYSDAFGYEHVMGLLLDLIPMNCEQRNEQENKTNKKKEKKREKIFI